jgi:hypothetical protein
MKVGDGYDEDEDKDSILRRGRRLCGSSKVWTEARELTCVSLGSWRCGPCVRRAVQGVVVMESVSGQHVLYASLIYDRGGVSSVCKVSVF